MKKYDWIAALTVMADQGLKIFAETALKTPPFQSYRPSYPLIPGVIDLVYAENTGMAFSLFEGQAWLLGVVSALCILAGWLVLRQYKLGKISRIASMLMLGGAAGNMIDRFLRGYVVDMFRTLFVDFPIFNLADAALTVGTALMAFSLIFRADEWSKKHDGSN